MAISERTAPRAALRPATMTHAYIAYKPCDILLKNNSEGREREREASMVMAGGAYDRLRLITLFAFLLSTHGKYSHIQHTSFFL